MKTIIRYTLITAMRDWLFLGLFVLCATAIGLAIFLGSTALVEQSQMAMSYAAGATRFIVMVGLITFVCFHVRRSFENRELEVILSRPLSRASFVCAYWCGFALLGILVVVPLVVALAVLLPVNYMGLAFWGMSLMLETALVMAFTLLAALILRSAVSSVLASLGFYILSRMMGFFVASTAKPTYLVVQQSFDFNSIVGALLKTLSIVFPRLDLFGKSTWLVYGVQHHQDMWIFPVQSLVYIPFLLVVAVIDFRRKQF